MTTQISSRLTQALKQHGIEPTPELLRDLSAAVRPERRERGVTAQQACVATLLTVTGWNAATMYARAAKLAKSLADGSDYAIVEDQLNKHYGSSKAPGEWNWYSSDWRGQKGQRPSDAGIRETWKSWEKDQPAAVAQPKSWNALAEWMGNGQD
jgi:hypothetical protein